MTDTNQTWTRRVSRDEIPEQGLHVDMTADANVRAALVKTAGLVDLTNLKASFDLTRKGREGLQVLGKISADLVQKCIVTLDPVEQKLDEEVDLVFLPQAEIPEQDLQAEAELAMAAGGEAEPPEPLIGNAVDLGAIATEHFLLGIDPYPRKEGAVFEPTTVGNPVESPFAALAALKKEKSGDE